MSLLSSPKQQADQQDQESDAPELNESMSDAELLSQFLKLKNETAFTALVNRYGHMVFAVAVRIVRDRHSAEDVVQATFLLLAKDAKKIRRREALSSWLHGVAIRLAKKALKRRSREKVNDVVTEIDVAEKSFEEIHSTFEQQVLDEELQGLPPQYRDPLVLHFLQGRTYEETAQLLGVTVGAIEGRMKRGKRELQLRLTKRGVGLGAALAALSWSQGEAMAAIQPEIIHTIAENGLAAFQGTAFTPTCSPEAVFLAGKEVTMLTTTKIAFLTCSLAIAAGAGWMSHVGFAQDGSGSGSSQGFNIDTAVAQFGGEDGGGVKPKPTVKQRIQAQKDRDRLRGIDSFGSGSGDIGAEEASGAGFGSGGFDMEAGFGMEATTENETERQLLKMIRSIQETRTQIDGLLNQTTAGLSSDVIDESDLAKTKKFLDDLETRYTSIFEKSSETGVASFDFDGDGFIDASVTDRYLMTSQRTGGRSSKKMVTVEKNRSPQEERIETVLSETVEFEFPGNPLSDVADFISERHGVNIVIDEVELSNEGLSVDDEVVIALSGVSLKTGLNLLLDQHELTYLIQNEVLMITTKNKVTELTETRVYDVRPLQIQDPEALADVLLHTIDPDSWAEMGGNGDISFLNGSLVVRQNQKVHEKIEVLLNQLARQVQTNSENPAWPAKSRPVPDSGGGFF